MGYLVPAPPPLWAITTTTTTTPPPLDGQYISVKSRPVPWRCEYCGTTHGGLEYSPCCNCGAPARVSVYGAQR
jgi:hypothetical protein